jgi:RNA polymerase sigma-70 factor (ECF subfamily)
MRCEEWSASEESGLVRAAQSGDVHAFDRLARRYSPAALILARRSLGSRDGADDVVQDALIAAYKGLPRLNDPDRFAAWLAAIVRNRAMKELTGAKLVTEPLSEHLDRLILKAIPSIGDPRLIENLLEQEIFETLPEETREIADLYYRLEWPIGKIAELFGLTKTTVKWRLHTVRTHLRRRHSHYTET